MTIDVHSATWLVVKAHVEGQIEAARNALEMTSPANEHDMHRGSIRALRGILALTAKETAIDMETGSNDAGY